MIRRAAKFLLFAGGGFVAFLALVALLSPRPDLYGDVTFSTAIYDRNGELLRLRLAHDERYRLFTPIEDIAPAAIDATLLYEDRYFFRHPGFNPLALARAAWTTYVSGDRVMGASTITMQLARLRFDIDTRQVSGKLLQIARAVQLERHYSKHEILEAYLNLAPYGGNVEGIATAALVYFDMPASEIGLPQALSLAVVPQNPVRRNPVSDDSSAWYAARTRLLSAWLEHDDMTADSVAMFDLPLAVRAPPELPLLAPHFVNRLQAREGVVGSTIDLELQRKLESQLERFVERKRPLGIHNASAKLVDTRTMQVLASVGSAGFFDDGISGQVDGTTSKRSPGSTLKPFVYGMAIDRGLIHPASLMKDAPRRFAAYTPENYDRGFMGPISATDALVYSRNVPAIELLSRVGHTEFHEFLEQGQVRDLVDPDFYGLAMVLGGIELTMEEVLKLYAMLANGGKLRPLNTTLDEAPGSGTRLLSPEASYLVLDMLRQNPRPGRSDVMSVGPPIAWKTGTSFAFRDAWAVGVLGDYALAVWVGNFDGSGNPALVGRTAAAPLFFSIADALQADNSDPVIAREPTPELNLRQVPVCAGTGDLPGRHCPRTEQSWFIPGVSPIRVSDVHRAITIDTNSGMRACNSDSSGTHEAVFEFWPSDILSLFETAGIAVRQPPPWSPDCELALLANTGTAPEIRALSEHLTYQLRPGRTEALALQASTDADVRWLYWFIDDRFVGRVAAGKPLLWKPVAGRHQVLAVDDLGRSDSITLTLASVTQ